MSMLLFFIACAALLAAYSLKKKAVELESQAEAAKKQISRLMNENDQLTQSISKGKTEIERLNHEIDVLGKYRIIVDAEDKARSIVTAAQIELENAKKIAAETQNVATQNACNQIEAARIKLENANDEADKIVSMATKRAEEIAGDAYKALQNSVAYESTAKAMKNIIEGYGDQYIVPTYSLLDELAEDYSFTESGSELKKARERTRNMVKTGRAANCNYVETHRKETAVRFVVDAFSGKVDSILSRTKADNFGTLQQAINDAFSLVNHNGAAFRGARITPEFLQARLEELRWAVVTQELKDRDREEQRRIKEQIREEERARKEFEKAIKDAEKDEELLRKAMDKVQKEVERASEEQKTVYEAKLLELAEKLRVAEERSQRALSMAQQTRSGHVYVISNIGSFGEEVFKIGMTRRLEPRDRVRELGDASVPFEFDIHAMIYSEDAPSLEKTLHKTFLRVQMNKVNPRKEFFRVSLSEIRKEAENLGIEAQWTLAAAAREFRESLSIERAIFENPGKQADWLEHQIKAVDELVEPLPQYITYKY